MNIYRFNCTYTDNLDVQIEAKNQEEAEAIIRNLEYPDGATCYKNIRASSWRNTRTCWNKNNGTGS